MFIRLAVRVGDLGNLAVGKIKPTLVFNALGHSTVDRSLSPLPGTLEEYRQRVCEKESLGDEGMRVGKS